MKKRVDLEKLIEEFKGRENTKRFRDAIAGTFENNKSVEMTFKILIRNIVRLFKIKGYRLQDQDTNILLGQIVDLGRYGELGYDISAVKDENASAILYIQQQYETLLNICEIKVEQLTGVLEKIRRCRKLKRAQEHASKVLKEI